MTIYHISYFVFPYENALIRAVGFVMHTQESIFIFLHIQSYVRFWTECSVSGHVLKEPV